MIEQQKRFLFNSMTYFLKINSWDINEVKKCMTYDEKNHYHGVGRYLIILLLVLYFTMLALWQRDMELAEK